MNHRIQISAKTSDGSIVCVAGDTAEELRDLLTEALGSERKAKRVMKQFQILAGPEAARSVNVRPTASMRY